MSTFLVRGDIPRSAGVCKGCGAAILWATTAAGRPMPLDALDTTQRDPEQPDMIRVEASLSHWSTCSVGESFRPPRKAVRA